MLHTANLLGNVREVNSSMHETSVGDARRPLTEAQVEVHAAPAAAPAVRATHGRAERDGSDPLEARARLGRFRLLAPAKHGEEKEKEEHCETPHHVSQAATEGKAVDHRRTRRVQLVSTCSKMAADVDVRMRTVGRLLLVTSLVMLYTCHDVTSVYWNYDSMTGFLQHLNSTHSNFLHLYSIGKSVQGRELWVVALGSSPHDHVTLRPEVKFVGNIHGNEVVSRDLLLRYIDFAIEAYGTLDNITYLLNTTRLHLLVSMNPDGFEEALSSGLEGQCKGVIGRFNAHHIDLNRNFPDYFEGNAEEVEVETSAVMKWLDEHQFVISAGLHGGALVANYPYDNYPGASKLQYNEHKVSLSPDDDVFQYLALSYSFSHPRMHREKSRSISFRNGTTNGAAWYPLKGGMQDYNYIFAGCMELTLELSKCKFPHSRDLTRLWQENKQPLTELWAHVHMGVKGIVSDALTGAPVIKAKVKVEGRLHGLNTTVLGEYWRLLLPGTYRLEVTAGGYVKQVVDFVVVEGVVTVLNVSLTPDSLVSAESITLADWSISTIADDRHRPVLVQSGAAVKSLGMVLLVPTLLLVQFGILSMHNT